MTTTTGTDGHTSVTTDAQLIARSRTAPEHLGAIFDRHAVAMHAFLARRAGAGTADDLLGEVFTVAFDRRGRYDPAFADAVGWLYGIAHNVLRTHLRSTARRGRLLRAVPAEQPEHPWDDVDSALDARTPGRIAAAALAQLPAGEREVVQLLAWEGLQVAEIARTLGIPAGTARSRLHRARAALRAALTAHPNTDQHGGER